MVIDTKYFHVALDTQKFTTEILMMLGQLLATIGDFIV